MTSTHTSLAAARAPASSPLAALSQMPSTFALTVADSVGALLTIVLQMAAYSATAAALGAAVEVGGGVELEVEVVGVVDDEEVVVEGLCVDVLELVVLAAVELVVSVVPEPLEPQPASRAAQARTAARLVERVVVMRVPPWVEDVGRSVPARVCLARRALAGGATR
jgi:hypothetical protein